jgi:hypothetical protein
VTDRWPGAVSRPLSSVFQIVTETVSPGTMMRVLGLLTRPIQRMPRSPTAGQLS